MNHDTEPSGGEGPRRSRAAYTSDDRELLLGVFRWLLWDWVTAHMPRRVSPNALTLLGQALAVLAVPAAWLGTLGRPAWFLVSAALLFLYMTLDNVDGPHARRTGQTSPIGELLDHGLDGFGNAAAMMCIALAFRVDAPWIFAYAATGACAFVGTFWEQYHTQRLILPSGGPVEGMTAIIVFDVLLFAFDDPTWLHFSLTELNVATLAVLGGILGFIVAAGGPVRRGLRRPGGRAEAAAVCALIWLPAAYIGVGAAGLVPALVTCLFGGDLVVRYITGRHRGHLTGALAPIHALPHLPLLGALALPQVLAPTGWASIALGLVAGLLIWDILRGIVVIRRVAAETLLASMDPG